MLRNKYLVPLSRQHQHALALCVRIDRAGRELDLEAWQAEIQQIFEQEISVHFAAEEKELFPAAARFAELQRLVEELLDDHSTLRQYFADAAARQLDLASLRKLAERLSAHIRKEERQLFEEMQRLMSESELAALGPLLDHALAAANASCVVPSDATRLRPKAE